MTITTSRKMDTLRTKIAGENRSVQVEYLSLESDWMSFIVNSETDALLGCYCHRYSYGTKIERTTDGRWLVVVYKTKPL